jgi:hypothetical protein
VNGEEKRGFPLAMLAGIGVVLAGLAVLYLLVQRSGVSTAVDEPLPLGEAEQAYAEHIRFDDHELYRAANFLGQEVTYLSVVVANEGDRRVREVELTYLFYDLDDELVMRDRQRLLGPRAAPLEPGERREIQIGWEHVPVGWNQHVPRMQVSGLLLD